MLIVGFDRALMGFALAVHIILAGIGIALPVIMLVSEYLSIKNTDNDFKVLSKRISIAFVILFAVGTASGTLVALNLLFLWPKFMALVSQVAILPLYVEVFAFFLESIFLAIYIYSWDKFKGRYSHLLTGIPVALGAVFSAVFITMINAFMNVPVGFDIAQYLKTGAITAVQPLQLFVSQAAMIEINHVVSSSYAAGSMLFAAYAALMLLRTKDQRKIMYYKKALKVGIVIGVIAITATIITGVLSIRTLATIQPEKYAAIEGNLYAQAYAPERIGGIPVNGTLKYSILIPDLQSVLACDKPSCAVPGLSSYPQWTWPPLIIHLMFDVMFFAGVFVGLLLAAVFFMWVIKRDQLSHRSEYWVVLVAGALTVLLVEDGWTMAELGRQPWIIYNVMTVSQAANYSSSILPVGIAIFLFYLLVIPFTIITIRRIMRDRPLEKQLVSK